MGGVGGELLEVFDSMSDVCGKLVLGIWAVSLKNLLKSDEWG